jgi:hypothetical protein
VSPIRALERVDLPEVAELYELVARSGRSDPPPGLAPYFERTFLDQPWADPDIPSLVHTDPDGRIVAFQGSSVRRARFDGRPIRIACAGPLVAHPEARHQAVGALLVRAYLAGPQDLTITDGATLQMGSIWTLLGGDMAHLQCIHWTRVLRPWRFATDRLVRARAPKFAARHSVPMAAVDALTTRSVKFFSGPSAANVRPDELTPSALVEYLPLVADRVRLHVAYDQPYLEWLWRELAEVSTRGTLIARLIREPDGERALGWYVYFLQPGGTAQVLQIAAADRAVGLVIDHLLHHAWAGGAAAVQGRVEPRLLQWLAQRRCLMTYAGESLVHSRDQEILGAIASGGSLLTRLDGEWWMGHHVLEFNDADAAHRRARHSV